MEAQRADDHLALGRRRQVVEAGQVVARQQLAVAVQQRPSGDHEAAVAVLD
jgi:hypothetical protein